MSWSKSHVEDVYGYHVSIFMTNNGNAILRGITVQHPAAKTMIEIARTQDEEVGDGTTSIIILHLTSIP